jgi:hypothetical protein
LYMKNSVQSEPLAGRRKQVQYWTCDSRGDYEATSLECPATNWKSVKNHFHCQPRSILSC